jgi:hypothetical protein
MCLIARLAAARIFAGAVVRLAQIRRDRRL